MFLDQFFNFIYHRTVFELILWGIFAVFCITLLYRRFGKHRWWKTLMVSMLLLWAAAVLYTTVFSRSSAGAHDVHWIPFHTYRALLAGGNPELLRSAFMNVALFFPGGILYAGSMFRRRPFSRLLMYILLVFSLFSLSIEFAQYSLGRGAVEIDDVLHNTLGAMLGFASFHIGGCGCKSQQISESSGGF